ncbi:uncharacterized protein BDR25DRAFT_335457 [Lindgomyces ingoldianus]|uniref:Uncharacterized protein n=1 Tax=Lindgomyces ingoldianus TaxID=673940 RepID=A0ACB6QPE6_9PLEO|nr:uncharacterized protein BDR25DRAFT_335457 [Lindgomyces ingoldianus]KAF2468400.1 hypothetical protein BDR25DRAFT_335457 [Lindgomyces ingoldianus]
MADQTSTVSTGANAFGTISNNHGAVIGSASGTAHVIGTQTSYSNYYYYHPVRPETPPSPSCSIPFRRDLDFVDRKTLLDQILEKYSAAPAAWIALVGLGGVGKSQLAIEHCYRTAERSPETWVFWAHASNAARLEQSYQDIADRVKLADRKDPQANVFKLVYDWMRDNRNGKWILVLDNVDDASFLLEAPSASCVGQTNSLEGKRSQPLITYIPQCQNGSVLITTRRRSAALQLVEQRDIIAVEPMDKSDALALLQKKLGQQDSSEEVIELAAVLEFMPLAIVQAAAYISQRRPRYSVQQYLEDFRRSDRKRTSLLDCEGGQLRRDWEAKNSIIITWHISFDYIRRIRPSAASLLALMSFYDRQGIPEALLRSCAEEEVSKQGQDKPDNNDDDWAEGEDNASQLSASNGFEDDVLMLRDYSFISVNINGTLFEMHGLVQLATRKWLDVHGKLEKWKQQFISNLCAAFPTGNFENWVVCQALFPHAMSAAAHRPEKPGSLRDWGSLLYRAAWYALEIGNWVEGGILSVQAMEARKKTLGQDHEDTLWSMEMVGNAYRLRGQWDGAEELFMQVMETRKKKLGADHPDTLTSMANLAMANLAFTRKMQGRDTEAIKLMTQCVQLTRHCLGASHPYHISSSKTLAGWEAEEVDLLIDLNHLHRGCYIRCIR